MNLLQFFDLLLLLVLAVNGTPKPDPKANPKALIGDFWPKSKPMTMPREQMTILLPGYGMAFDSYGNDISGNSGFGNNGGFGNFRGKHRGPVYNLPKRRINRPKPEVGHGGGCFAATSSVETREGFKEIPELRIGDEIRTSEKTHHTHFTEFLGWLDRQESSTVEMLQLFTSGKYPALTLSASHVVFTSNSTKYAGDLVPGDTLLHWDGREMVEREITEIRSSLEPGYWAPMTGEGTLLVNGFLMSCYASYPHQLSEMAYLPVKAMPRLLLDDKESQHMDGVRSVVKVLKHLGQWFGARRQVAKNDELSVLHSGENKGFNYMFARESEL